MLVAALAAGLVGSLTIVICLAVINLGVLHTPGFSLTGLFTFDASTLVGKAAYGAPSFVALGIVLHVLVSVGWAIGYAVIAQRQAQLVDRPLLSGAAFGLVVYFAMQLVIVAADLYHIPTPGELGIALLAHMGFYGIPVALIVARSQSPR
jgi:uncharacterized membrane protein YagU involved in acid resistance